MTADITLASSGDDSGVLEAISQYQAELMGAASVKTTAFLAAATGPGDSAEARTEVIEWADSRLRPYLQAEAAVLFPALEQVGNRSTVELSAGHTELLSLLDRLTAATRPADAGAAAAALQIVLAEHFQLQSRRSLPALAQSSTVSLPDLWGRISFTVGSAGSQPVEAGGAASRHVCECGILDDDELPELDVRTVPHAIRHATVFGALDAVDHGSGLVLVAPHDPLPLLAQIEERAPGAFDVQYLDRDPEAWRLQFRRIGAAR